MTDLLEERRRSAEPATYTTASLAPGETYLVVREARVFAELDVVRVDNQRLAELTGRPTYELMRVVDVHGFGVHVDRGFGGTEQRGFPPSSPVTIVASNRKPEGDDR